MVALFPRAQVPAARVDTHPVMGDDGVLQVHLTRYIADPPVEWLEPETLDLHLMAIHPPVWEEHRKRMFTNYEVERGEYPLLRQQEVARWADVVITVARDDPPMLVLDEMMRRYRYSTVVGVQTGKDRSWLVGLRTTVNHLDGQSSGKPGGYAVTMTPADLERTGPLLLYPSALLGWSRWWLAGAQALSDRNRSWGELPPPPLALDVTEAWRTFRITLSEPELTSWPPLPPLPHDWRSRFGLDITE